MAVAYEPFQSRLRKACEPGHRRRRRRSDVTILARLLQEAFILGITVEHNDCPKTTATHFDLNSFFFASSHLPQKRSDQTRFSENGPLRPPRISVPLNCQILTWAWRRRDPTPWDSSSSISELLLGFIVLTLNIVLPLDTKHQTVVRLLRRMNEAISLLACEQGDGRLCSFYVQLALVRPVSERGGMSDKCAVLGIGRRAMILRLNEGAHLSDVTLPELRNHFGLARGSDVLCLLTAGFVRGFDIIRYLMVFRAPRRTISRTCSNISKFQCVLTSTEVSGRRHTCHTAKSKAFTCTP